MSYKEKLSHLRFGLFKMTQTEKVLPEIASKQELSIMDDKLDLLLNDLKDDYSLLKSSIDYTNGILRLIILLDISGSMLGTEEDIYYGLKNLVQKHKNDNILFHFVTFNETRRVLLNDVFISNVKIPRIDMGGGTNLNGTLYHTLKEKCYDGLNLVVTISDGDNNSREVSEEKVKMLLQKLNNGMNHFYFLGEPNIDQTLEDVYSSARRLGFGEENISVFTRMGNGNRLNFEVISKMLDDLLAYGSISNSWSEPIKEHYFALTDKRR